MVHFDSNPVIGGDSGEWVWSSMEIRQHLLLLLLLLLGILTLLKHPYPRCVEEPDVYDSIRVHAEGGVVTNEVTPTFAVSGFMYCYQCADPVCIKCVLDCFKGGISY